MLPLVQALRYDLLPTNQDDKDESESGSSSNSSSSSSSSGFSKIDIGDDRCPLVQYLLKRCSRSIALANDFYWYIQVEKEDTLMGLHYINISKLFLIKLNQSVLGQSIIDVIENQIHLVNRLKKCHFNSVFRKQIVKQNPKQKSILLKESLGESQPFQDLQHINVVSPLDATVCLQGILPDKAKFFASATCPMFMLWKLKPTTAGGGGGGEFKAETVSSTTTTTTAPAATKIRKLSLASLQQQQLDRTIHSTWKEDYSKGQLTSAFLFKTGTDKDPEDMRQDQLVVQLIDICDRLFKKQGNLDLKLTPYKIVCLSRNCGLLEFVDNASHITDIKEHYSNVGERSIQNYLRQQEGNHAQNEKYQLNPEVLETFIRSSAGYCVITYILAVGDRHLENLMVKKTGHLLHIDFGKFGIL